MASFTGGELAAEMVRRAGLMQRIAAETHDLAVAGFNYAQAISPVGDDAHSGDFQRYWSVRDYKPRFQGDLPMSQIRNDDPGAISIEYGTHDTPPHHTLTSTKTFIDSIAAKDIHI
jgi:hypothetical protein